MLVPNGLYLRRPRIPISNVGIKNYVQSVALASPIGHLCEQKQKVCFCALEIFTTWYALVSYKICDLRTWLRLRSMCSRYCLREVKRALRFTYFGSREHLSYVKVLRSKVTKLSFMCCDFTQWHYFFWFPSSCLKCLLAKHYVACSFFSA